MEKLKVLLVEDDKSWQDIYKRNIEKLGYDIRIVGSKNDAVEVLEQESFDLSIVDVRLDEADEHNRDGLQVLERISKLGENTRSIVVTGHGDLRIARDALQRYDAVGILEKDEITPQVICDLVKEQIQKQKPKLPNTECSKLLSGITSNDAREILNWESRMQTFVKPSHGIEQMYELFQKFVEKLFPILYARSTKGLIQNNNLNIVSGYVWSKRFAHAMGIFIGNEKDMGEIFGSEANFDRFTFESYPCSNIVLKVRVGNLSAVALSIRDMPFAMFK